MATSDITTLACTINSAGITCLSYADTLAYLQDKFKSIYGSDIYIEPDSQDGQWLALLAQTIYDGNQADITVFNSYSPAFAQGAALSSQVKINGIRRAAAGNSTAVVEISGIVGTQITNGIVVDTNKNQWNLPALVEIPLAGVVSVTATAQNPGAITAIAGAINQIGTPTKGWQTVINPAAATPGAPVQTDAALRKRQAASTPASALTPLQAIKAAVAAVPGIGRSEIYNNDTDVTDANGIPRKSICVVAEGGDITAIAQAIATKKAPGTGTYGTTAVLITDPSGVPLTIRQFVMAEITIMVQANIVALAGYVSTTGDAVIAAIAAYLSGFAIGQDSLLGKLFGPANLSGDAAVSSSGMTQAQLDALSATYNLPVSNLYQGRSDMLVTGGPYAAGVSTINMANVASISIGRTILVAQADGSQLQAVVTGVSGSAVSFTPAIAIGKSISNGAQVLVNGDLNIAFNEGAVCAASNITLVTS